MPDFRPPGEADYFARVTGSGRSNSDVNFINPRTDHSVALDEDNNIRGAPKLYYMDVGCWIESRKYFGVIYGDSTWGYIGLCRYAPSKSVAQIRDRCAHGGIPTNETGETFTRFLCHCKGYLDGPTEGRGRQLKCAWSRGLDTGGEILVFLGDLHLPVATESYAELPHGRIRGEGPLRSAWETWEARFRDGILAGAGRGTHAFVTDANWLQRYYPADIFGGAASSLNVFLGLLEGWGSPPVHLIQVGDLYDMWIGLHMLFEARDDRQVVLTIPDDADLETFDTTSRDVSTMTAQYKGVLARDTIIDWMRRADRATRVARRGQGDISITSRIFTAGVGRKTFIVGNHDCYTQPLTSSEGPFAGYARPNILRDPSQPIDAAVNTSISLPQVLVLKYFSGSGVFIEHGHDNDSHNRFGASSGWEITQFVYVVPDGRRIQGFYYDLAERYPQLESERETHIQHAVVKKVQYAGQDRALRVYVMAHTHAPFLARVQYIGP